MTRSPNPEKEILKAAKSGRAEVVKELLRMDSSLVSARDRDGSTPLHCACWKGHETVVRLLLESGADVNAENNNGHWGTTPLHAAAHANQERIAEMLIAHGANIAARNINNRTPLNETTFHNARAVAELLKKHGAGDN